MVNYLIVLSNCTLMENGSENKGVDKGAYHALEKNKYIELDKKVIGDKGRIHTNPIYAGMPTTSFMTINKEMPGTIIYKCEMVLLPKDEWIEVTQSKGKNAGQPLTIYTNGDMTAPYKKGHLLKVFIDKGDENGN